MKLFYWLHDLLEQVFGIRPSHLRIVVRAVKRGTATKAQLYRLQLAYKQGRAWAFSGAKPRHYFRKQCTDSVSSFEFTEAYLTSTLGRKPTWSEVGDEIHRSIVSCPKPTLPRGSR